MQSLQGAPAPSKPDVVAVRETVAGFRAGLILSSPEPLPSRSFCYRHGFYIGRFEAQSKPSGPSAWLVRQWAEQGT